MNIGLITLGRLIKSRGMITINTCQLIGWHACMHLIGPLVCWIVGRSLRWRQLLIERTHRELGSVDDRCLERVCLRGHISICVIRISQKVFDEP